MKREDLIRYVGNKQRPMIWIVWVVGALFVAGFILAKGGIFQKIDPAWSDDWLIPAFGVVTAVILLAAGAWGSTGLPKCPHCGRRFTMWFVHIAIASGNCGYCGKSIEG